MPGFLQTLGGFGTKVIGIGQALKQQLGEVIAKIRPIAPTIEPMAAARDWGRVRARKVLEPQVLKLRPDETIPRDLYIRSDIPWSDKFAYQVAVYGRDRTTGQMRNQTFDMTMKEAKTIEDIETEARYRFGGYEGTQFSEVWDVKVTGAWKSPEVEW